MLNAKPEHAEREGETIAEAGRPGTVTIATNMAGRGVDIKLGGNAEHLTDARAARRRASSPARPSTTRRGTRRCPSIETQVERAREQVLEAGGLFILGTERHESRRIDNQLRGRSGRQGDPGESRFYLSAEDDLVRLFAGDRIYRILDRLGPTGEEGEEEPIEAKMLSKQIEGAQKKVEEQNFLIRKRVLEYDDVMNQQREIIYEYRDQILEGEDMSDTAREQLGDVVERMAEEYLEGDFLENWDLDGLYTQLEQMYPVGHRLRGPRPPTTSIAQTLIDELRDDIVDAYDDREEELGDELMRALERFMLLQIIDERWREHLHDMDYLREGIHLRGFAQIDPLVAYKNEGFEMFTGLMNTIWEEFGRYIFVVEVEVEGRERRRRPAAAAELGRRVQHQLHRRLLLRRRHRRGPAQRAGRGSCGRRRARGRPGRRGLAAEDVEVPLGPSSRARSTSSDRIGRNDPCWCGSGKKFKKCHGANRRLTARGASAAGLRDQLKLLADYL